MQIFGVPIRSSKKLFIQLVTVFMFSVVALALKPQVFAQNWYDSCTAGIYCTGPCNVVWDPPGNVNNCACEAQGCNNNYTFCRNTSQADYESCCTRQGGFLDSTYPPPLCNLGSCLSGCYKCGGTGIIQGTCPSYYNPCINICSGASPTPTPTPPPRAFCGNGTCNISIGEICSNCPQDCGACPTPIPVCGNGTCESWAGEGCANCAADCGACSVLCDPNNWVVDWHPACLSCDGPATQSRTNECGTTQDRQCLPYNSSINWGDWLPACLSCDGPATQSRTNECLTVETQQCLPYNDSTIFGPFSACSLDPGPNATKTHTNQCGTPEKVDCTGTIEARAVEIYSPTASCTDLRASTQGIDGAEHGFTFGSASQPDPLTQTGASYVTFPNVVGGYYSIDSTVPAGYVLNKACWIRTNDGPTPTPTPSSGTGVGPISLSIPQDNETLTWDLGYLLGIPWVQTGGGNVYAALGIKSYIAALASPRSFSLNGTGGYPGVVRYGTTYDFDADPGPSSKGETLVSDPKWLAQETDAPTVNYYEYFRIKLGGPITPSTIGEMRSPQESMSKPPSRTTPYFVVGDMTTSGDWTIPDGETVIFIINGNLTLGGKVNLTGSGFVSFIVNGNIIIDLSVGTNDLTASAAPVIEGIYVTSPTGTFATSLGSSGHERFVGKGIFVAGNFSLQRDLGNGSDNTTTSSELFLYNPQLLFTMPDSMKDVPIKWEEVAP